MGRNVVVLVRQNGLGTVRTEDQDFAAAMFEKFLHTLESQPARPTAICFYTEGVRLACTGSQVLFALKLIQGMGVRLVLCSSCLDRYGLKESVEVGEVRGMNEIVPLLLSADSVITV
jgi:hypothetical protein